MSPTKLAEVVDFIDFLQKRERSAKESERFQMISQYAQENAGTEFDLDSSLEIAGVESLLAIDEK